ncbi:class I SAM-dependent methyltransferase [Spongisporangium articulatum]|uniref:Class I SAM-dependent methyltransferase n=1 Tax=Spongisporangium articulatum TaxID=3362603 RepID=A0ABW8AQC6_9ACTN
MTPPDAPTDTSTGTARGGRRSFAEVFAALSDVQGWMTQAQAERLWAAASRLGAGARIVEIGSYHGRSAIVLSSASVPGVEVYAIDPHGGNDRGPQQIHGEFAEGQADHETFMANLAREGVRERVTHIRKPSQDATDDVPGLLEVVYIDGAHRYEPARADIVRWGRKVAPGGTLLIHDSFSSIGVTLALLTTLVFGAKFRYVGRSGTMTEYRREDVRGPAYLSSVLRQLAQLPYFARNVFFKVLIVLGLRRVTRLLGHGGEWPY